MRLLLIIFLLMSSSLSKAQHLIPDCEWTTVGHQYRAETFEVVKVDFDTYKTRLGANFSDDEVIASILKTFPDHVSIRFSEGEYHFKKQIKLKSYSTLKGSGPKTKLIFDLVKEQDPILVQGKITSDTVKFERASSDNYVGFKVDSNEVQDSGCYLLADNDDEIVESWWAKGKTGQLVLVEYVYKGEVEFQETLNREYNSDAYMIKVLPVRQVEISDLTLINNTKTETQTSNICFRYALNCLVKNVESIKCNYAHVLFEFSAHSTVKNCSIEKAHDYGNGGKGYGVALQFATSSCTIEYSKFDSLRHAILLQAGANCNYIGHNESTNPYWTDVKLPASSAGDIVLHGNYAYANLFEFNKCQTIVIDNSHGINGPYNTFFANEVTGYGIWQLRGGYCGPQYFINNTLTGDKVRFKAKEKEYHQYNQINGKLLEADSKPHLYKSMIQGYVRY